LMVVSLFYASISSAKTFLVVASMMGSYYVYSVPPIRFKRALLFSKSVIGFNSFAMVVLGFVLVQQNMMGFNKSIVWIYIFGITLAANFIDLKDVSGDKAAGILTLPVWIGLKRAKLFVSVALFFLSLSFYFIFNDPLLLPVCLISGGLYVYLVNKKAYHDRQILWLCNINFILMIAYLLWGKQILH
jgi:4-hydroxybenzoate polyprenyltransferase